MKGFLFGVLVTSGVWAGLLFFDVVGPRIAEGPRLSAPDAGAVAGKSKRRRRVARRPTSGGTPGAAAAAAGNEVAVVEDEEPEPMELSAADLRSLGRGDDLSSPDVLALDLGSTGGAAELTQDDIDEKFRARQPALLECINKARPDEVTFIPGRVTVKFRIQRNGQVRGVRVDAPAILHQGGLYTCVRNVVLGLRFPASNGSQVITYPFQLS